MALLQCKMCCGELEVFPEKSVEICKYCGSTFTIPKEIEKKGSLYNRANYLRQNCDFDNAIAVYQELLADNWEDADALWGLVLCRYGIEFVEDPVTHSRKPTCHRASRTSILVDPDYKLAINYADKEKKRVYQDNAQRIDQIQKEIWSLSEKQEKFDVFICYKESDADGARTPDSIFAQTLYDELTDMKFKTFFARITLKVKAGSNYEPLIFSALNSAKVMIVIGTKREYFEATWVRNEWSRYLAFMKEDPENKYLIPLYKNMKADQLPAEFSSIQALDMSSLTLKLDLFEVVKRILRKEERSEDMGAFPISKDTLYTRAHNFLGNREFYKAVDYFDKVLDLDPEYSRAYWGSLLASYQCVTENELINHTGDDWTEDAKLKSAIKYASKEEKEIYEDVVSKRIENLKTLAHAALESKDFEKCQLWCDRYLKNDISEGSIWWIKLLAKNESCNSNELFEKCCQNMLSIIDTEEYQNAIRYSIPEESMMYEKTAKKIDIAVNEKKRIAAYDDCGAYMRGAISALKKRVKEKSTDEWYHYRQEADTLRELRSHSGKFYQNNLFVFLLRVLIWLVPFYIVTAYFVAGNGLDYDFLMIFGIAFGILMGIVIFVNICKHAIKSPITKQLTDKCYSAAEQIENDKKIIDATLERQQKAEKIFEEFQSNPDISVEEIERIRKEFDAIYG